MPHVNHQLSTDPEQILSARLTLAPASMSLFTTSKCPLKLAANNGQCYFECYRSVEIIFNHLELVVKMNNITTTVNNSNVFIHASSVCAYHSAKS